MKPTLTDVHVDKILTNFSVAWKNELFIAEQIFPPVIVEKESDKYFVYGQEAFKLVKAKRADGAPAVEVDWSVSTDSYSTDVRALSKLVTERMRANADIPLNMDRDTTEFLTEKLAVDQEDEAASIAFSTAFITNYATLVGTAQWNNYDTSDPFSDIELGKESIRTKAGKEPNLIAVGGAVFAKLRQHPDILDRLGHHRNRFATSADLAQLFEVENFLVGRALKDTAAEGVAAVKAYIWGKHSLIAYVAPKPALKTLTLGITFRVRGYRKTKRFPLALREGDLIEVDDNYAIKIVSTDCGFLIADCIA